MSPSPADFATPDLAGMFAAAHSLWKAIFEAADHPGKTGLSEAYTGIDQLMREVMRAGMLFEAWACRHIAFEESDEVWPYFIADHFGAAACDADCGRRCANDHHLRVADGTPEAGTRFENFHHDSCRPGDLGL